jgi:predicted DsbA family dithiol-disulfide isomerase
LYENQDPNGTTGWVADSSDVLDNYFVKFATSVGVPNIAKFKTDFNSSAVNGTINADMAEFAKTGLDESTPTFLLDGKQIHPGYAAADFQKAIDAEIKAKATSKS